MMCVIRDLDGSVHELGVEGGRWVESGSTDTLDLSGLWSVPGLADAHAHLSADPMVLDAGDPEEIAARAYVAVESGVFLCLDKGWGDEAVLSLGTAPPEARPHLQAAGRMIATRGGYYEGFATETDDEGLAEAGDHLPAGRLRGREDLQRLQRAGGFVDLRPPPPMAWRT